MKKKLAVFELTGCGGCNLNIIFLGKKILDLLEFYEICHFQMMTSKHIDGPYDVGIVTGSVSSSRDLQILKEARESSKILIALGTCAVYGGLQAYPDMIENELVEIIYGKEESPKDVIKGKAISSYVNVELYLPGCPYDPEELFQALIDLAKGTVPAGKDYPVCLECKLNEYECVLVKKGVVCLGPVTLGGCNAACIRSGVGCIGCRGPLPKDANFASEVEILRELGYSEDYIKKRMSLFSKDQWR